MNHYFQAMNHYSLCWGSPGVSVVKNLPANRGWDGWMASLTGWTWVSVNSKSWCWTESDTTEQLNWTECRRYRWLGFDPWVRKIPWWRKWQPTPVFLPGRSHGQRSLQATACGVTKSWTQLSYWAHTHSLLSQWIILHRSLLQFVLTWRNISVGTILGLVLAYHTSTVLIARKQEDRSVNEISYLEHKNTNQALVFSILLVVTITG